MDKLLDSGNINHHVKKRLKVYKPFWDEELTNLWKDMKNKQKLYLKNKKSQNRNVRYKNSFLASRNVFDRTLRQKERKYKHEQLENLESVSTSNPKEFWEKLNSLGARNKSKIPDKARKPDGNLTDNMTDTLNVWKQDFSTLFNRPGYDTSDGSYLELINELNERENQIKDVSYESDDFLNEHILILEIKDAISRLKKGKATGLDQIPNEILKCDKLLPYLCKLFNICFDFSITPTCWSQSIISPVPKGSMTDKYVPLQYRGISLLSCVYKLYSALLNKRLYSFLDVRDWFDDAQNGFRGGQVM